MRPGSLQADPLPRIALFSDVDGTLLDASDRLAIGPADVDRLAPHAELILASSRTLIELGDIQRRLGIVAALIGENGAVVSFPPGWRGGKTRRREILALGDAEDRIRPRVQRCALRLGVDIMFQRDLLPDGAKSLQRGYSVCVRNWIGPDADRFLTALRKDKLQATTSGRWITVTSGADKGTGVREVLKHARKRRAAFKSSVGIGNEANDHALLAATQLRFAIRNPRRGHHDDLLGLPEVTPLDWSGKRAWRVAMATILPNGTP
jgi:predicted mannosyl-3-phosphoglycerate phosphatase (HAD superfamily)